jgi:hypothetical protein
MNLSIRSRPAVRGVLVAATTALLLTALAGCSEDKETVASWSKKGGHEHITAIGEDMKTLIQVSGSGSADPTVASRCSRILDDVKAAKAYRDLPDKNARASWEETLGRVQTAASHCVRDAKTGGGASLTDAIDVEGSYRAFVSDFELALAQS